MVSFLSQDIYFTAACSFHAVRLAIFCLNEKYQYPTDFCFYMISFESGTADCYSSINIFNGYAISIEHVYYHYVNGMISENFKNILRSAVFCMYEKKCRNAHQHYLFCFSRQNPKYVSTVVLCKVSRRIVHSHRAFENCSLG